MNHGFTHKDICLQLDYLFSFFLHQYHWIFPLKNILLCLVKRFFIPVFNIWYGPDYLSMYLKLNYWPFLFLGRTTVLSLTLLVIFALPGLIKTRRWGPYWCLLYAPLRIFHQVNYMRHTCKGELIKRPLHVVYLNEGPFR